MLIRQQSLTPLERVRREWHPPLPALLKNLPELTFLEKAAPVPAKDSAALKERFAKTYGQPILQAQKGKEKAAAKALRVGVVFSGGQAPGGHNVISGLFDALKSLHPNSQLFGFLHGPSGVIEGKQKELTAETIAPYRNQGGFDLIGSGRIKIETDEQLSSALAVVQKLKLDGLVIIGGDDSNTNAAVLAEYFLHHGCETKVVGVPKTIDGDLKNDYVEISFGFDTASKIYAEVIGNIARDALSARKYTHFVKLMGRTASHIALECALIVQPNFTLIGEECAAKKQTLRQVVAEIADLICKRAELGKNYGVFLIPEGLIEFLPDMKALIAELNTQVSASASPDAVAQKLTPTSKACFLSLPERIQSQLLLERDPHGNVQVSLIETELLLIQLVKKELAERQKQGSYKGKFAPIQHFFGYEGRAGFPSNFDATYCYALGFVAALLLSRGKTGYMVAVQNLTSPTEDWQIAGVPLTMLMHLEKRGEKMKPVIQKALVDLKGSAYKHFEKARERWATEDLYRFPGPIQFYGEEELINSLPLTMTL